MKLKKSFFIFLLLSFSCKDDFFLRSKKNFNNVLKEEQNPSSSRRQEIINKLECLSFEIELSRPLEIYPIVQGKTTNMNSNSFFNLDEELEKGWNRSNLHHKVISIP